MAEPKPLRRDGRCRPNEVDGVPVDSLDELIGISCVAPRAGETIDDVIYAEAREP
jgi:hypothetical protein